MKNTRKPEAEKLGWDVKNSTLLFESQWYDLRQDTITLPSQDHITYTYVEHPGCVFVVPITAQNEMILIHSYRYPIDAWCWEIPAGNLGDRAEDSPEEVARQELKEEIGGISQRLEFLGRFSLINGFGKLYGHYFLARNVEMPDSQSLEASEVIDKIELFPLSRVRHMICEGVIHDAESAFAILLALQNLP
ncbi:NUDIX hydrolase [candidate division KSB3 bacterium]|uniref:NUDIX hydrolase n=1 Tax=candidate division KSB3 bacterium TaxID=2044937 RepID=A0A2G6KE18_9BACT|nr:MAG: NUDIX hydrolase [candidate division KSB3 bacterium]